MATIKEIAAAAGVSIGTVDRILHNRGRYSQDTAQKVHRLVKEMGYTPNPHGRGLKKSGKPIFSVIMPNAQQDNSYWSLILRGVNRALQELSSLGAQINIYHFNRYSEESCGIALKSALEDDSLALVIVPVRPRQIKEFLNNCKKPFVFIDSNIPEINNKITFIGQDSFSSGKLAAKLMSLLVGNETPVFLVIDPYQEDSHLRERVQGFIQGVKLLKPLANIKVDNNTDKISLGLNGIFVANSMVYTVGEYLKQIGDKYKQIPLIGYDLIPGGEGLIETGVIDFIITQQPWDQGYLGIMTLYNNLIMNKEVENQINIPMNIITKENLHTFIQKNKN